MNYTNGDDGDGVGNSIGDGAGSANVIQIDAWNGRGIDVRARARAVERLARDPVRDSELEKA